MTVPRPPHTYHPSGQCAISRFLPCSARSEVTDMFAFSRCSTSPLRYVTQIAEHLFLIPDQLDPSNNEDSQTESGAGDDAGAAAAFMEEWLAKITGRVVTLYFNSILAIPALSPSGQTQLSTDMQYLCSILDRLGAPGLEGLKGLKALVEADVNALPQVAADSKLDRHVIDKMSRKLVR